MKKMLQLLALGLFSAMAYAEAPSIEGATFSPAGGERWRVSVTLKHPDSGWDHYADAWQVVDANGKVLGERVLAHPHENEQPFTRSLGGVKIPAGTESVWIRAKCSRDGWVGESVEYPLPQ